MEGKVFQTHMDEEISHCMVGESHGLPQTQGHIGHIRPRMLSDRGGGAVRGHEKAGRNREPKA